MRVDDAGARYPLTIDPYFQGGKLTASGGATDDYFGLSLAIDGDIMVVGARDDNTATNVDQGSVYVFVKPASGWTDATQTAKLTASDGAAGDGLGRSVAIDGDTIVAGALYRSAAYVYRSRPAAGSTTTARMPS